MIYAVNEKKEQVEEWSGEGLPPVGTEFQWKKIGVSEEWNYGYSIGFDKDGDLVIQRETRLSGLRTKTMKDAYVFRPIPTPRERWVEAAHDAGGYIDNDLVRKVAVRIYDALSSGELEIPEVKK